MGFPAGPDAATRGSGGSETVGDVPHSGGYSTPEASSTLLKASKAVLRGVMTLRLGSFGRESMALRPASEDTILDSGLVRPSSKSCWDFRLNAPRRTSGVSSVVSSTTATITATSGRPKIPVLAPISSLASIRRLRKSKRRSKRERIGRARVS